MKSKKFTPPEFAAKFAEAKLKSTNQAQIAEALGISRRTLQRYLRVPEYTSLMAQTVATKTISAMTHSETIIDTAYKLYKNAIAEALVAETIVDGKLVKVVPNYKEARRLSIEALKIAITEAQIKRLFVVMGDVNIDARTQQLIVVKRQIIDEVFSLLCPKCQKMLESEATEE